MAVHGAEFSQSANYIAIARDDGGIRFWDTESSQQKQEYTPAARLTTTCSCLKWSPFPAKVRLAHLVECHVAGVEMHLLL